MTFPLKELSHLLVQDMAVVGSVVHVDGTQVRVATERGAIVARPLDGLAIGDRVLIQKGIAIKAPVAQQIFPV